MKNRGFFLFALITLAGAFPAFAQSYYVAEKIQDDYQGSNTTPSAGDYYLKAVETSYTYQMVSGPGGSASISSTPGGGGNYSAKSSTNTSYSGFNTQYPDSTYGNSSTYYMFTDPVNGTSPTISAPIYGDSYPTDPALTEVNSAPPGSTGTPSWNVSGQLVLDPTVNNTLTWNDFTYSNAQGYDYATGGAIDFKITLGSTLIASEQAIGPDGQSDFDSYEITAGTLTAGDYYTVTIANFLADSATGTGSAMNPLEEAGYETDDIFTVYAAPEPFTPGLLLFGGAVLFFGLRRFCPRDEAGESARV